MDLSIPPTPLPGRLPPGTARGNRPILLTSLFFSFRFSSLPNHFLDPKLEPFNAQNRHNAFSKLTPKKYKNHCFSKVLATLASIFLPFRTRKFIIKYNRIGPRGPFSIVKYNIFIKFNKKNVKISLFEVSFFPTFFGALLGPIWLPFSGPKISIFFQKISKNQWQGMIHPSFLRHFLPSALRTPKMCPKGPQNAPKILPKMSPRGLQKSLLRCLRAPSSLPCHFVT